MNAPGRRPLGLAPETAFKDPTLTASDKDFLFNQHVINAFVDFLKVRLTANEAVENFGGEAVFAVRRDVFIRLAELVIFGGGESLAAHFEGVANLHAKGEEILRAIGSKVARGNGARGIIKARVVGIDFLNAVRLAILTQSLADSVQTSKGAFAVFDFVPVGRDFVRKVGAGHNFLIKEDFGDGVGRRFEDFASVGVNDCPTDIVTNRLFKGVSGFGIKNDDFHLSISFLYLSFVSILYHTFAHLSTVICDCLQIVHNRRPGQRPIGIGPSVKGKGLRPPLLGDGVRFQSTLTLDFDIGDFDFACLDQLLAQSRDFLRGNADFGGDGSRKSPLHSGKIVLDVGFHALVGFLRFGGSVSALLIASLTFYLNGYVIPEDNITRLKFENQYVKVRDASYARNIQM